MPVSNVAITNTFDEWRIRTNQLITIVNRMEDANLRFQSNSSVIQVYGGAEARLGNVVYFTSNAMPTTGGVFTGNISFSGSNLVINLL